MGEGRVGGSGRPDRLRIGSGSVWEPLVGYSRAVRVGPLVFVAGTTAAHPDGGVVGGEDTGAQAAEVLRRIAAALDEVGASVADVVQTRMYVTDIADWESVGRAHGAVFGDVRPVATMVEVSALIDPLLRVEIEAVAVVADQD